MKKIFSIMILTFAYALMYGQSLPSWLLGCWEIPPAFEGAGSSYEEWSMVAPSTMEGKIYRMFDADTVVFDRIMIVAENSNVILKMSVEKDGVRFVADYLCKMLGEDVWVFENKSIVSPTAVYYRNFGDGVASAWLEVADDKEVCSEITMYRIR